MSIIKYIKEEMQIIEERDPAIHSKWEVFLYPSFKVMLHYRLAHKLYLKGHYFWARWISQRGVRKTGIEIHPGAQIGKGLFIDHGNGVIIGETTIIGDNCTLYQGVTLGGTGKEHGKRHPTIGNNVMISAGAKVLGSFKIGDNSKIGSGSVVLQEVPPNSTVVGVPGRVVERKKKTAPQETMDQCNLPNPVEEDILKLQQENESLARRIYALEEEMNYRKTGEGGKPKKDSRTVYENFGKHRNRSVKQKVKDDESRIWKEQSEENKTKYAKKTSDRNEAESTTEIWNEMKNVDEAFDLNEAKPPKKRYKKKYRGYTKDNQEFKKSEKKNKIEKSNDRLAEKEESYENI